MLRMTSWLVCLAQLKQLACVSTYSFDSDTSPGGVETTNLQILPQKHLTDFARRDATEGMHFELMKACLCVVWPYI